MRLAKVRAIPRLPDVAVRHVGSAIAHGAVGERLDARILDDGAGELTDSILRDIKLVTSALRRDGQCRELAATDGDGELDVVAAGAGGDVERQLGLAVDGGNGQRGRGGGPAKHLALLVELRAVGAAVDDGRRCISPVLIEPHAKLARVAAAGHESRRAQVHGNTIVQVQDLCRGAPGHGVRLHAFHQWPQPSGIDLRVGIEERDERGGRIPHGQVVAAREAEVCPSLHERDFRKVTAQVA